ncbi:MAG: coproporphyrinogen III oxidase family protein [Alphaproteobacteria bacterium]|nr:coproporphyrinogen III oxidase family protein [Alphaproteobacteria bacterium]
MSPFGVYVHLPWCRSRCPYCSFNVRVDPEAPQAAYADAVLDQWAGLRGSFPDRPDTLFFGGGTPSLTPPPLLARLVAAIAPVGEVTLEANPEDLSPENLDAWRAAGITRLSVGAQTFSPAHARLLKRAHSVRALPEALSRVIRAGFESWSADLIFAVPGQSLDDLRADLDALLSTDAPHASLYGLTTHPGTAYTQAVRSGRLQEAPPELWRDMYDLATATLEAAGLARYEVSNFARSGHRSRHNEHYWRARPYAGLGAGAHGWLPDGRRTVGHADPAAFIESPRSWASIELPAPREAAIDLLLGALRHVDGVPLGRLRALGFDLAPGPVNALIRGGALARVDDHLRLQGPGWPVSDAALLRLVDALAPVSGGPPHPETA